jgi:hypothetical protein
MKSAKVSWNSLAMVLVLGLAAGGAAATERCGELYAGNAQAALKFWEWNLGASSSQSSGKLFFVPLPDGVPDNGDGSVANPVIYVGATSFRVGSHSTLVLPLSMFVGEAYTRDSLTPDDSPAMAPRESFMVQKLRLTLDGHVLLDSARTSLACAYVSPEYFLAPISYDPPQYRYTNDQGVDVYASAAMWVTGLALNVPALEPGRHRMHLHVDTLQGYGYDNTWTITVDRR